MQALNFEYFKGIEAEQYNFYRIPKVLFTGERFRVLSCEAKVLYGLILDRMSLSIKNRWIDELDRVYVIFTVDEIVELLNCSRPKAVKNLAELDTEKGIGLIEKKRLGLGQPNVIYVKNFMTGDAGPEMESMKESAVEDTENVGNRTSRSKKNELLGTAGFNVQKQESHTSRSKENELLEVQEMDCLKSENDIPRSKKSELLEVHNLDCNDTDINKTDISDTENSKTDCIPTPIISYQSGNGSGLPMDMTDRADIYRDIIRCNIFHEGFSGSRHALQVDELVELMVDVMLMPDDSMLRIAGTDKSASLVKNRLMKLGQQHMEYVLECLEKNTGRIGNIRSYLLTVLYNAPVTMDCYYQAAVNHDMFRDHTSVARSEAWST